MRLAADCRPSHAATAACAAPPTGGGGGLRHEDRRRSGCAGMVWGPVGGGGTRPHIVGDLEGVTSSRRRIGAAAWD